jgi:hypothetical protein
MGNGALVAPRAPIGTATNVMSPETIARAITSVVPFGCHLLASGLKTCARSVIPGGNTRPVGDAIDAVGVALAAVVAVGVGDEAADVVAGGPEDEHAAISNATMTGSAFLT